MIDRLNRLPIRLAVFGALLVLLVAGQNMSTPFHSSSPHTSPPDAANQSAPAHANLDRLPLAFEPNRGQAPKGIDFLAHGPGYAIYLTGPDAVLATEGSSHTDRTDQVSGSGALSVMSRSDPSKSDSVVRLRFLGANQHPRLAGVNRLPGRASYFAGNVAAHWHTGIATFSRVLVRDVYPGIDAVYYGRADQLEYDLIVHPHADLRALRLRIDGTKRVRVTRSGDLVLDGARSILHMRKPLIYQRGDGGRRHVLGYYVLQADRVIGFHLGRYDRDRPLVIDPTLSYSTYVGGESVTNGNGIAFDRAGDTYVVGVTSTSASLLTCPGFDRVAGDDPCVSSSGTPLQSNNAGNSDDAFVAELNPTGTELVYSTYLGGAGDGTYYASGDDDAYGIAVDSAGDAYVTGDTSSSTFPTCPGNNRGAGSDPCASSSGMALQSSSGPAYTAGNGSNAFVAELNPGGTKLIYSTYLGGSKDDTAAGIAIDPEGDAFITGSTDSTDFPTCPGSSRPAGDDPCTSTSGTPLQSTNSDTTGVAGVAFIAELNSAGTKLIYSTYLGTEYDSPPVGIAIDSSGDAYVAGNTDGADSIPTCPGSSRAAGDDPCTGVTGTPLQTTPGHGGYAAEINSSGTALVYSTYLNYRVDSIAVAPSGAAYVAGETDSTDLPTCPGSTRSAGSDPCASTTGTPLQSTFGGTADAIVSELRPGGTALVYSTYLGGAGFDGYTVIAVDSSGDAYVTGITVSTDFPTCPGSARSAGSDPCVSTTGKPLQSSFKGDDDNAYDAFVAELNPAGDHLVYGTYFGSNATAGTAIVPDSSGDTYLTGYTDGSLPTCPGSNRSAGDDACGSSSGTPLQTSGAGIFVAEIASSSQTSQNHTLTVSVTGSGEVTSSPAGIDCGNGHTTCSAPFAQGSSVTLSETAASGSTFGGWGGACSGTGSCSVTMSADESVSATFDQAVVNHTLTVSAMGSGEVTSSPAGIDCGNGHTTCSAPFAQGSSVTLSETAASGSTFGGWGGACSGTGSCSVTMSADESVSATFDQAVVNHTLTVSVTGSGEVTSSPAGIDCGNGHTTCSAPFGQGSSVTLSETAASGSTFGGWGGACSGTGACSVSMSGDESVTATFRATTRAATRVKYTGPKSFKHGKKARLTATLASHGHALVGKVLTFTLGGKQSCHGTSSKTGVATCKLKTVKVRKGKRLLNIAFAGNTQYAPSKTSLKVKVR